RRRPGALGARARGDRSRRPPRRRAVRAGGRGRGPGHGAARLGRADRGARNARGGFGRGGGRRPVTVAAPWYPPAPTASAEAGFGGGGVGVDGRAAAGVDLEVQVGGTGR